MATPIPDKAAAVPLPDFNINAITLKPNKKAWQVIFHLPGLRIECSALNQTGSAIHINDNSATHLTVQNFLTIGNDISQADFLGQGL